MNNMRGLIIWKQLPVTHGLIADIVELMLILGKPQKGDYQKLEPLEKHKLIFLD